MTSIRLVSTGAEFEATGMTGREGWRQQDLPSLLVSYYYRKRFPSLDPKNVREWVLDSGAFSAMTLGKPINLDEYIEYCKQPFEIPPTEIFGLDVIGDWEAGIRNCEKMWREGVRAIPTYHIGEPKEVLVHLARSYPKIAISVSGTRILGRDLMAWTEQVFSIAWPAKIHGFALVRPALLEAFPFHSVDSTSWSLRAQAFGSWISKRHRGTKPTPGVNFAVNGTTKCFRDEVDHYLRMERRLRVKWAKELAELDQLTHPLPPAIFPGA